MRTHKGQGQGKVILLGEHAVVYGAPAIAVGLGRGIEVVLSTHPAAQSPSSLDSRASAAFEIMAAQLSLDPHMLRVEVRSELPAAAGLGSSAALCVALARALLSISGDGASPAEISKLAMLGETVFHGNPSGLDVIAAIHGGVIRYCRNNPQGMEQIPSLTPIPWVIADTGERSATHAQVEAVATLRAREPQRVDALLSRYAELVDAAWAPTKEGRWEALGSRLNEAHELLSGLGVSSPKLDAGVALALGAGAWGAKLTGAGGGGCLIALAPEPARIASALRAAGFDIVSDG